MERRRILLLSRYSRLGASSRIRSYQYLPYLKTNGFHVTVAPLLEDDYLEAIYTGRGKHFGRIISAYFRRFRYLVSSRHYDLLWIEKELFPWLPAWAERLLARFGVPYVVDYDDAIFHRYDLNPNFLVRTFLGAKIDMVMAQAALVIVGNDYLAERAKKAGAKRVEIVPSAVDMDRYPLAAEANESSVFTIGWIGTPLTAQCLEIVKTALAKICEEGKARVLLIGAGSIELSGVPIEFREWSEDSEVKNIQCFDVGIMPLHDTPWERGKCGYKLIQYMACAKPVVASPVGVNKDIVQEGVNGFLASTTEEWVRALETLRDNPELRMQMGLAGRRFVEERYCVQVIAPRLAELLKSVC